MSEQRDVLILMGSQSDASTIADAAKTLRELGVSYRSLITSAHRTPDRMVDAVSHAEHERYKVIIACAGGSAHLPGMCSSHTILPVLGVAPNSSSSAINEIAAIGSMIAMPGGVPLAYLGLGKAGAKNAALVAARILALHNPILRKRLRRWVKAQTASVPLEPEFTDVPNQFG